MGREQERRGQVSEKAKGESLRSCAYQRSDVLRAIAAACLDDGRTVEGHAAYDDSCYPCRAWVPAAGAHACQQQEGSTAGAPESALPQAIVSPE